MQRAAHGFPRAAVRQAAGQSRSRLHGKESVATATAGAFRGVPPPKGGGSSRRFRLLPNPAGEQETKMHRVGVAFVQLTRSTFAEATAGRECLQPPALRARCNWKDSVRFCVRQAHPNAILSQIATISIPVEIFVVERSCDTHSTTKMHRARCSLVRLSTDRRRSDCLSESHQPRALRPRCTWDTRASRGGSQAPCKSKIRSLRSFLYKTHTLAFDAVCSTKDGTKVSPSRVRFCPLPRLTFRFRVRPPGRASSYSRPVLGAAAIYAVAAVLARRTDHGKAANCELERTSGIG